VYFIEEVRSHRIRFNRLFISVYYGFTEKGKKCSTICLQRCQLLPKFNSDSDKNAADGSALRKVRKTAKVIPLYHAAYGSLLRA
jgi:hypothetical protein